jgi:MFS family permease
VRQPAFAVALTGAAVGYGVMILAMTATPLAMVAHHHDVGDAAFVIQWHVLGMFVPSFFTGTLIARFGVLPVMFIGAVLLLGHVTIALSGVALLNFVSALVLLGVGWNFLFIGGTTLLTETYRPSEKGKVQGVNDFLIVGVVVIASFASALCRLRRRSRPAASHCQAATAHAQGTHTCERRVCGLNDTRAGSARRFSGELGNTALHCELWLVAQ